MIFTYYPNDFGIKDTYTIIFIIIITFDISDPLTSEMIATPLPCNITVCFMRVCVLMYFC